MEALHLHTRTSPRNLIGDFGRLKARRAGDEFRITQVTVILPTNPVALRRLKPMERPNIQGPVSPTRSAPPWNELTVAGVP